MASPSKPIPCPCGGKSYAQCCARFIERGELPQSAEQLMRSRYTAYTQRNDGYLLATWHASRRPAPPVTQDGLKWLGLEVRRHAQDGDRAVVEFVARCRAADGRANRLHETSRFVREEGRWYYVDGDFS
jgi:SEC-C motif-containing protein